MKACCTVNSYVSIFLTVTKKVRRITFWTLTPLALDFTEKQFQKQLAVSPHKQTLLRNTCMEEKYFTLVLRRNIIDDRSFQ